MATDTQTLDLAGVYQQAYTFRFDLLDVALVKQDELHPVASSAPTIENDSTRTIPRQMSGLALPPAEQAKVDPLSNRIRPALVLASGGLFTLGVFIFSDAVRSRETWGLSLNGTLTDQLAAIDQGISSTFIVRAGTNVASALQAAFAGTIFASTVVIDSTLAIVAADLTWTIGTSLLKVINDIAALGAYWPCFTDNAGVAHMELVPDLSVAPLDHSYEAGGRILPGSILESDNLLTAPNRYVVVDTSATVDPVSGIYNVPDSAPHSAASRGFVITAPRIDLPGVGTPDAAAAAAKAKGVADVAYQKVTFASTIDPRHDTHDITDFLGDRYYETKWSLPCTPGSAMTHELQRVYS